MNLQTLESNGISVFLTAYNSSDLPCGSLATLGFERGGSRCTGSTYRVLRQRE